MSEQTVFDVNISPEATADIFIIFAAKQIYNSGATTWQLNLYYDEVLINYAGGGAGITDSPTIIGVVKQTSAGVHRVRLSYDAGTSLQLKGGNGEIRMLKK